MTSVFANGSFKRDFSKRVKSLFCNNFPIRYDSFRFRSRGQHENEIYGDSLINTSRSELACYGVSQFFWDLEEPISRKTNDLHGKKCNILITNLAANDLLVLVGAVSTLLAIAANRNCTLSISCQFLTDEKFTNIFAGFH